MNVVIFFGQAPRPLALPPQLPFRDLFPGCVRGDAYLAVYLAVRPPDVAARFDPRVGEGRAREVNRGGSWAVSEKQEMVAIPIPARANRSRLGNREAPQ